MDLEAKKEAKSWELLEKIALASIVEQRRKRRWGIFFKSLGFLYVFVIIALYVLPDFKQGFTSSKDTKYVGLINIQGMIADNEPASSDRIVGSLRRAFEYKETTAIIMRINSPGGSPVQSGYIYDEIKRLRAKYPSKKIYAVISDLGASGAYYIASAADEIYADKASLVGSIGVTAATFGYVDVMKKVGVERRTYTAGAHKSFLDPFSPMKKSETEFWQNVLNVTHQQFINSVKQGRGERLKYQENPEIFSGLIWSGEQALELGLVDGLGSTGFLLREKIGIEDVLDFTEKDSPLDKFAKVLGTQVASHLAVYLGINSSPSLR